jgi:hypothetical protein
MEDDATISYDPAVTAGDHMDPVEGYIGRAGNRLPYRAIPVEDGTFSPNDPAIGCGDK